MRRRRRIVSRREENKQDTMSKREKEQKGRQTRNGNHLVIEYSVAHID